MFGNLGKRSGVVEGCVGGGGNQNQGEIWEGCGGKGEVDLGGTPGYLEEQESVSDLNGGKLVLVSAVEGES